MSLYPYEYETMLGEPLTDEIVQKIERGNRFKVCLYPLGLKGDARANDIWYCKPQPDEIYTFVNRNVVKLHFNFDTRTYNNRFYEPTGKMKAEWYINSTTLELVTFMTNIQNPRYQTYRTEEFRIILEPYDRCWNAVVVREGINRMPIYMRTYNPLQFAALLQKQKDQEALDTGLLVRKHDNQRKRARTPSPDLQKAKRKIIAKTALQRRCATVRLQHPTAVVVVQIGNNYFAHDRDAAALALSTEMSLSHNRSVVFHRSKLEEYREKMKCRNKDIIVVE